MPSDRDRARELLRRIRVVARQPEPEPELELEPKPKPKPKLVGEVHNCQCTDDYECMAHRFQRGAM